MVKGIGTVLRKFLKIPEKVLSLPRVWVEDIWENFKGPKGYIGFASLVGIYFGLFSIIEAKHDRDTAKAYNERNGLTNSINSGRPEVIISYMKIFGPIQRMGGRAEPSLFRPWKWWRKTWPNRRPLQKWGKAFFGHCSQRLCSLSPNYRIDFSSADLNKVFLVKTNLSQADFEGAQMKLSNLKGSFFHSSNLIGVNMEGAIMKNAKFIQANLSRALLLRVDAKGADFSKANLQGSNLSFSNLKGANFSWANLGGSNLIGANLIGAKLSNANLKGAIYDRLTRFGPNLDPKKKEMILSDWERKPNLGPASKDNQGPSAVSLPFEL